MIRLTYALAVICLLLPGFLANSAQGTEAQLAAPSGKVVLRVTGQIAAANVGEAAEFDLAMLQALPATTFTTGTIWTTGKSSFTGVLLKDLLELVGAEGSTITATALNDYAVQIPVSDAVVAGPIVAYLFDGKTMSVREKGPLWVIYPFDDNPDYQSESTYSRSIWQLKSLHIGSP